MGACGCDLRKEPVAGLLIKCGTGCSDARLKRPWGGREIGRGRITRYIDISSGIYRDRVGRVPKGSSQKGAIHQRTALWVELADKGVVVTAKSGTEGIRSRRKAWRMGAASSVDIALRINGKAGELRWEVT